MSISNYAENAMLGAVFNSAALDIAAVYVKLHIGNPGEACTANPSTETTRKVSSWAAAASGAVTTDAVMTWAAFPATETITHWSAWDAATNGNALWYGALTAPVVVTSGQTFDLDTLTASLD